MGSNMHAAMSTSKGTLGTLVSVVFFAISCGPLAVETDVDAGVVRTCEGDRDCPGTICLVEEGVCVLDECLEDTECGDGLVCDTMRCGNICVAPGQVGDPCFSFNDGPICGQIHSRTCAEGLHCDRTSQITSFGISICQQLPLELP